MGLKFRAPSQAALDWPKAKNIKVRQPEKTNLQEWLFSLTMKEKIFDILRRKKFIKRQKTLPFKLNIYSKDLH